jgi:hypothetical protein
MADNTTPGLSREMYKQIKHLDKTQMEQYIRNIYAAGFDAGYKAALEAGKKGGKA